MVTKQKDLRAWIQSSIHVPQPSAHKSVLSNEINSLFRATFTAEGHVQVRIPECGVQRDIFRLVR